MNVPDAVLARIVASLPGGTLATTDTDQVFAADQIAVFDGFIPETPPARYVIVYIGTGTREALAACSQSDSMTVRWQTTSVAADRAQAAWLAERTRDGTLDTRPQPDGWSCGQVRHVYNQYPQRDETVPERPVVYQVDQYEVLAAKL